MSKFSDSNGILIASDLDAAVLPHWGLGAFPASGYPGVIAGWTGSSEEGGVPSAVTRVLARAMTTYGRVTFPCSAIHTGSNHNARSNHNKDLGEGWWQVHAAGDDQAALSTGPVPLVSSLREETVADLLFEDPYYQWWNASQFAIVSRPPEKLPVKPWQFAKDLFEDGWAGTAAAQGDVDVVLRSGVDGDVCGIAFATGAIRQTFGELLHAAAGSYGVSLRMVPSADFGQLLSEALGGPA
jgi:hypothetical protein